MFECQSPDNAYVAVYSNISGGGAAGVDEYFVTIQSRQSGYKWKVFHMKDHRVRLTWLSSHRLKIEYLEEGFVSDYYNVFGDDVEGRVELMPVPADDLDFLSLDVFAEDTLKCKNVNVSFRDDGGFSVQVHAAIL